MAIKTNSRDWHVQSTKTTRARGGASASAVLPADFIPDGAKTEEFVAEAQRTRGAGAAPGALDLSTDLAAGEAAVLAVRHESGALTFHAPRETVTRTGGGPGQVRFFVPIRTATTDGDIPVSRGVVSKFISGVVIKVADRTAGAAVSLVLSKLASTFEAKLWEKKGLHEGWLKVTKAGLASGRLEADTPTSSERSLLLIHGTFSNAAGAYKSLAESTFFEDVTPLYADRIFAFDHFTISRTPEENVRMLLKELPNKTFTFDVITHSRGGLVLRNLVERSAAFGAPASRFALGRAVLVAAPNEGTPLATPSRWEDTVGWVANLIEIFPENPFTTGAEFVANGLFWIARHASGDLPGIHSMDGDGELVRELQSPPGPPADRYSVLAANYSPSGSVVRRLLDMGIDQFFNSANDLVVPSEGGWRVDPTGGSFIPGERIGCFGPGGNIPRNDVAHVNFFAQPETVSFLVAALNDQPQQLAALDPAQALPDRRLLRAGGAGIAAPSVGAAGRPAAKKRARMHGRVPRPVTASADARLEISVVNGDLTFEERPLLIGHYRSTRLTGAERVIDRLLSHAMSQTLELGVYPVETGSHRIFVNRTVPPEEVWQTPRPQAVIVAGLGQEGKLQSAQLIHTVRQAALAWSERLAEDRKVPERGLSLATTLLASGGANMTPGQVAQLIAQGVNEANDVIRRSAVRERLPLVRALRFIELYLSRATEAWEALKLMAQAQPAQYELVQPIVAGRGALRRPLDSSYRGADYDFISAATMRDIDGRTFITYSLDTKRARTEVRARKTQARLLRDLVATASSDQNPDPQIGRTLYNLLVPVELESFLASSGETQLEVDEGTAGIPWEFLDDASQTGRERQKPWAIRSKLVRKLKTETFRTQVNDADSESGVLVIGEPECPADYAPLPGALQEAQEVYRLLSSPSGLGQSSVTGLFASSQGQGGPAARQVIDTLFARSYRIVHIAGHGEPVSDTGDGGGVVLSNDTFLGAAEIEAMRVVPELVFVNCCHLAAGSRRAVLRDPRHGFYDRAAFASGVAQALIKIGVRCVVAAGWAVDDGAAAAFATTFYEALLEGQRFIDAVAVAREKAHEFEGNTWAAYQCYGDPDWQFRRPEGWRQESEQARPDEFERVASINALKLALDTLVVQSTFQGFDPSYQRDRLRHLEQRWQEMRWPASSEIAERFARAHAAASDVPTAIRWYQATVDGADGDISFGILEQLSNLRIRQAVSAARDAISAQLKTTSPDAIGRPRRQGRAPRRRTSPQDAAAQRRARTAVASARAVIDDEMKSLETLTAFQATVERDCLRGSAMKRLAVLEASAGNAADARRAIIRMAAYYRKALDTARKRKSNNLFYPALNLIVAELALSSGRPKSKGLPPALFEETRESVSAKNQTDPDFWSLVAVPELQLYEAIARNTLSAKVASIARSLRDVRERSQSGVQWQSVLDTMRFVFNPDGTKAKAIAGPAGELIKLIEGFGKARV